MSARLVVATAAALLLVGAAGAGGAAFPDRIELPDGWQPEGIATGRGHDLYVGSIPTGAVLRVDARTGQRETVVQPATGRAAIGLKADNRERLFVAGGPTGKAFVYDAGSGELLEELGLAPAGAETFVNDVALTRDAAYFTDSRRGVLYVVDGDLSGARELALQGFDLQPGFNLNGIVAGPGGRTLIAVQSTAGRLWRIDARTGAAELIDLGGATVANGDGLLLIGRTLYVVQNQLDQIAVVRLAPGYESGELTRTITSPDFAVPTTIARSGNSLYAVNARFGTPPGPDTDYWITRVRR